MRLLVQRQQRLASAVAFSFRSYRQQQQQQRVLSNTVVDLVTAAHYRKRAKSTILPLNSTKYDEEVELEMQTTARAWLKQHLQQQQQQQQQREDSTTTTAAASTTTTSTTSLYALEQADEIVRHLLSTTTTTHVEPLALDVLEAWASIDLLTTPTLPRVIALRAEFLWETWGRVQGYGGVSPTLSTGRNDSSSLDFDRHGRQQWIRRGGLLVIRAWAQVAELEPSLAGTHAERCFKLVASSSSSVDGIDGATWTELYRLMIRAWTGSRERRAAYYATGHLRKQWRRFQRQQDNEGGLEVAEPTTEECRDVLRTWVRAEQLDAPKRALDVLETMENVYYDGASTVLPDLDCYKYALQTAANKTAARKGGNTQRGEVVDEVFRRMRLRFIIPNAECFEAAIQTYRNVALHAKAEKREEAILRTVELWTHLHVAHNQGTDYAVHPTQTIVHNVLEALAAGNTDRVEEAQKIFEEVKEGKWLNVSPTAATYKLMIRNWRLASSLGKVEAAKSVLDDMLESSAVLLSSSSKSDFVGALNEFLSVCASSLVVTEEEGMKVLRECLSALQRCREQGFQPNATTYAILLQTCEKFLMSGKLRRRFVDHIFNACKDVGLVDGGVLQALRAVSTFEHYNDLVVSKCEVIESGDHSHNSKLVHVVPESWTRVSIKRAVVNADGTKTIPLTLDVDKTISGDMKKYSKEKLRRSVGGELLRGGRLPSRTVPVATTI